MFFTIRFHIFIVFIGALASRLHAHGKHGDSSTKQLVRRIMDCVCVPLFDFIIRYELI